MMLDKETIIAIFCAAFLFGVIVFYVVRDIKKDKIIAMKDEIIAGKNDYILRLYAEYKKAKGIDKPFMIPLDPAPDFDIEAVFKAAEEEAKAEVAAEETEEGGAA